MYCEQVELLSLSKQQYISSSSCTLQFGSLAFQLSATTAASLRTKRYRIGVTWPSHIKQKLFFPLGTAF